MESQATFADVVLDMQARALRDRLFTYIVPTHLASSVLPGTQVLVPFGPSTIQAGYVVSVSSDLKGDIKPKELLEVIDPEPLFDSSYVNFLTWIASYYCTTLADVVSAAIPSFLTPRINRKVRLASHFKVKDWLSVPSGAFFSEMVKILEATKTGSLAVLTLKQRWRKCTGGSQTQFYRTIAVLQEEKILERVEERSAISTPKRTKAVLWTGLEPVETRHQKIINILIRHGGQLSLNALVQEAHTTTRTIQKLAALQLVTVSDQETIRDPIGHLYQNDVPCQTSKLTLSESQEYVLSVLSAQLNLNNTGTHKIADSPNGTLLSDNPSLSFNLINSTQPAKTESTGAFSQHNKVTPWLIHGVTGSGKTEIYLRLIEETLKHSRTALLLVPEIGLTPQLARRLTERFGNSVALWHSALSLGERYDTWRRLKGGRIKVLLGARSAVLVDMPNLGLIILDEEHDSSYKQTNPAPRYHAKEVALAKAKQHGALVLLGSATPDVATYFSIQKEGQLLQLPKRIFNQPFPRTEIVDMREEFANGNRSIFSIKLGQALGETLAKKQQAVLLINRRGYASHVFCRLCGSVLLCQSCSVSLVYHQLSQPANHKSAYQNTGSTKLKGYLACHHCGGQREMPSTCPTCTSQFIKQYGLGTQRVEEELHTRFPAARILRLDSDTVSKKGAHEVILNQFAAQKADILIGTQMVSKGLDIESVTLVGVLAADAAFNMPDYRSTERGFQLLTQVSGRAGRGQHKGLVILQTYNAELPALQWAQQQEYQSLYQAEITARQAFAYPPFSQLIRIILASEDRTSAEHACHQLAESLSNYLEELLPLSSVKVLGPAPCLFEKLRNKYRMHLLIKNQAQDQGRELIAAFLKKTCLADNISITIDVDAMDLF